MDIEKIAELVDSIDTKLIMIGLWTMFAYFVLVEIKDLLKDHLEAHHPEAPAEAAKDETAEKRKAA